MASFSLRRKVKEFVRTNVDDFLNPLIWVEVLVEYILCTFVSIIVIWALTTINPARYNPSSTHFAIFAGVAIIALIEGYGPLCGAPVNPVGVWGFLIVGRISLVKGKNLSEISVTKSTNVHLLETQGPSYHMRSRCKAPETTTFRGTLRKLNYFYLINLII